jgi:hypothetical protein
VDIGCSNGNSRLRLGMSVLRGQSLHPLTMLAVLAARRCCRHGYVPFYREHCSAQEHKSLNERRGRLVDTPA